MGQEIVTKEDLQVFRMQLLQDLKQVLAQHAQPAMKIWLKSGEVRRMLSLSAGKLQNLRITGKLRYSKVGNILYYRSDDVEKLLSGGLG
jgi:hypothetical protein